MWFDKGLAGYLTFFLFFDTQKENKKEHTALDGAVHPKEVEMAKTVEDIEMINKAAVKHVWQVVRPYDVFSAPGGFTIFTEGKGCHLTDV